MALRLLVCWLVLGVLCASVPASPPSDPHGLNPIITMASTPGVTIEVKWEKCDEANAYYENGKAVLCKELIGVVPDKVIQWYLTHEIAHGIIEQLDIPITGNEEFAADELAMVILHMTGRDDVLLAGSMFYGNRNHSEDPSDEHPGDRRRSFNMMRFATGGLEFKHAARSWARLIVPVAEKHAGF